MVIFNTPHNPTGHIATPAELALLAELCIKHNVIALADEVCVCVCLAVPLTARLWCALGPLGRMT